MMIEEDDDYSRRFTGVERVYGAEALAYYQRAHVVVVGAGGVGSWAIEALARNAIGRLTLIDMDVLVASNVNRQLPALTDTFGRNKIDVLAERARAINPRIEIQLQDTFLDPDNIAQLLADTPDLVLDCTDDVQAKIALILWCRRRRIPLIVSGAAGGKRDPSQLRIEDLARTERDPLLAKIRKRLRHEFGFPDKLREKFGITCIYSNEAVTRPEGASCDANLNCSGYGSAVAVTASMGLMAVAEGLRLMQWRMSLKERRQRGEVING